MWALGVIIYRIATAYTPRMVDDYKYGKYVNEYMQACSNNKLMIGSGPVPFEKSDWSHLSL